MKTKILNEDKVIYSELSYLINGILFETRKNLGIFCNEKQYCDHIEKLLKEKNIPYKREFVLSESFEGEQKGRNKVDFLIDNKIIMEIKAKKSLLKDDYYQVQRYLTSTNKQLAILVNMRQYSVTPKRILNGTIS
ncbi:MAG: hypothetical protein US50_C0009G0011 [Candidatus Nomurabacteria bacterium GW2011_GWB1_37_5]|uniref:GTP-binding signal recognition particle n=1 Tax=Candidatus Nomurabacteria bacterium GW2011_GWB1_37_5 TaxID=1618742 RepID=A0A0G0HAW1_9BACT|nr:MAG: hypothetical protein US50_C0009G0011 [Candidatus Nomurabacteria bacterium GW2011_GWB1_37_5]